MCWEEEEEEEVNNSEGYIIKGKRLGTAECQSEKERRGAEQKNEKKKPIIKSPAENGQHEALQNKKQQLQ